MTESLPLIGGKKKKKSHLSRNYLIINYLNCSKYSGYIYIYMHSYKYVLNSHLIRYERLVCSHCIVLDDNS